MPHSYQVPSCPSTVGLQSCGSRPKLRVTPRYTSAYVRRTLGDSVTYKVSVVALSSYSRGLHFTINCWQSIVVRYLVPGPTPCPEVVAVSYIRPAEVPTLFSVEGDAQVKQKNTAVGFITPVACTGYHMRAKQVILWKSSVSWSCITA